MSTAPQPIRTATHIPHIFVSGPSSWNTLVYLDHLPDPRPHTVFAQETVETPGGTSLGKALNLVALGAQISLLTPLGTDKRGQMLEDIITRIGITELGARSDVTERHINLMTRTGERLSIYAATPTNFTGPSNSALASTFGKFDALVVDLSERSAQLAPTAAASGTPVWTDLHDYDGASSFHEPFAEAADYVFLNNDALPDPRPLMSRLVTEGKKLVVCTLGADGCLAITPQSGFIRGQASPTEVIDTNGAGDAFMSAVLMSTLAGLPIEQALEAGAHNASQALRSTHLHPSLDGLV